MFDIFMIRLKINPVKAAVPPDVRQWLGHSVESLLKKRGLSLVCSREKASGKSETFRTSAGTNRIPFNVKTT
jgi:hypothetical protein